MKSSEKRERAGEWTSTCSCNTFHISLCFFLNWLMLNQKTEKMRIMKCKSVKFGWSSNGFITLQLTQSRFMMCPTDWHNHTKKVLVTHQSIRRFNWLCAHVSIELRFAGVCFRPFGVSLTPTLKSKISPVAQLRMHEWSAERVKVFSFRIAFIHVSLPHRLGANLKKNELNAEELCVSFDHRTSYRQLEPYRELAGM